MRNLINNWQDIIVPIIALGLGGFIMVVMIGAVSQF
jgi:hypothetical protein